MSQNRVIGYRGTLPWSIPEEYAHFLASVRGEVVVMGRVSWEIFGPDLTESEGIVISRSLAQGRGYVVFPDLAPAVAYARGSGKAVFIAGGQSIYSQALDLGLVNEMWLSVIPVEVEGDAFFSLFERSEWDLFSSEDRGSYRFERWRKRISGRIPACIPELP